MFLFVFLLVCFLFFFFFFSSRRRHTRCGRDWSSDVCSSDLAKALPRRGSTSCLFAARLLRKLDLMKSARSGIRRTNIAVSSPIWQELLVGFEMVCLKVSPVFWGFGIPPGDGSAVVVVPGFMGTDLYLGEFRAWLERIGYKAYDSEIGLNAECPNLLIRHRLMQTIEKARRKTRKRVHLVGHSLGGVIARALASQMSDYVASVITMGAPFRRISAHRSILHLSDLVRAQILQRHGRNVLPDCYTSKCTCDFLESVAGEIPRSVRQTEIFTQSDGIVDWRGCRPGR